MGPTCRHPTLGRDIWCGGGAVDDMLDNYGLLVCWYELINRQEWVWLTFGRAFIEGREMSGGRDQKSHDCLISCLAISSVMLLAAQCDSFISDWNILRSTLNRWFYCLKNTCDAYSADGPSSREGLSVRDHVHAYPNMEKSSLSFDLTSNWQKTPGKRMTPQGGLVTCLGRFMGVRASHIAFIDYIEQYYRKRSGRNRAGTMK